MRKFLPFLLMLTKIRYMEGFRFLKCLMSVSGEWRFCLAVVVDIEYLDMGVGTMSLCFLGSQFLPCRFCLILLRDAAIAASKASWSSRASRSSSVSSRCPCCCCCCSCSCCCICCICCCCCCCSSWLTCSSS